MKSNFFTCFAVVALTALLTFFLTRHFCCEKDESNTDGTRDLASICMDYENQPPATLTSKMIKSMVGQYTGKQLNSIQSNPANQIPVDARAIWFDLETLKQFMYQIEYKTGKNFAESKDKKLGVRIYYAAYPDNVKMRAMQASQTDPNFSFNPAYEKLHTLVMIPTISDGTGENYDFNPLDVSTYNGYVKMPKTSKYYTDDDYIGISLGRSCILPSSTTTSQTTGSGVIARNHGILIPPASGDGVAF